MENETPRNLSDAPAAPNAKSIREWLESRGAKGIITTNAVASIVGVCRRVIKNAENEGILHPIDRNTFALDDIVRWLCAKPSYIAQDVECWEINDKTREHIKAIIISTSQTMLRLWNNDLEDLTSEVCFRMSKRHRTSDVPERIVIIRTINDIWREMKKEGRDRQTSLDYMKEKGIQK